MSNKKQKDRTCENNCKDICGECQVIVFKKQTAVEWLIDRIVQDQLHRDISHKVWLELFEQAKAMEKEQIINANEDSSTINGEFLTGEQYYNETYEL
jgi:hypothetical protein